MKNSQEKKRFSLVSVFVVPIIALVVTYLVVEQLSTNEAEQVASVVADNYSPIGGEFALVDQHGRAVTSQDFTGKYRVVYFGFTHCPDVCPTDLATLTEALNLLSDAERDNVVPIFITVDPERDTVEQMKRYAENFHPDLVALTGDTEAIQQAIKAYRVFAQKVEDEAVNGYGMNHSALFYLMDKNGYYLTHFNRNVTAEEMVNGLKKYL